MRAATASSPTACWRRCATSSAGTPSSPRPGRKARGEGKALMGAVATGRSDGAADAVASASPNPLTAGLERLPVAPTTLVIFGATGDLARRKLLPALYNLAHEGALPERFHLVGVSRSEMAHEEYQATARQSIE